MLILKNFFKTIINKIFFKFINSDKIREALYHSVRDLFVQSYKFNKSQFHMHPIPPKYSFPQSASPSECPPPSVFITARFRSGSTFLWQIFRKMNGITCYYEPLHEKRWSEKLGMPPIDFTHIGVDDYDFEYQGLRHLKQVYQPKWARQYLYMNETHHDPGLQSYLSALIENADGLAVLQFNRMDFRLEWLRAYFPDSKIVHLYRAPREQWMSIMHKGDYIGKNAIYKPQQLDGGNDFYTLEWSRDLRHVFPFLEPYGRHPYEVHYLLWRLSYSFGKSFSDISIGYEDLILNFNQVMGKMIEALDLRITEKDIKNLASLNKGACKSRWQDYAPANWFKKIEDKCDRDIEIFFRCYGISSP